ncbi:hypothetical protein [uncultured Methylobacterium sp.]|uniref:hypothetical protein n=1 Tax=uncultured Methylobacterium sp. TaxID=157278 RepID=UPI00259A151D|nr:hypothetical protein [uncultured Methylobacterium sp.]
MEKTAIHILPASVGDADAMRQLTALRDAVARGVDLGPRGPHIQALGHSIEAMLAELRRETEALAKLADADDPQIQNLLVGIRLLIRNLTQASHAARNFSS